MPESGSARRSRGRPEEIKFDFGDDEPAERRRPRPPAPARPQASAFGSGQPVQPVVPATRPTPPTPASSTPAAPPSESSLAGMVFVPAEPIPVGTQQAKLQLRRMQDGRLAVLAFTSLDLLVAGCGPHQGWMAAPVEQLENLQPLVGFDVIALNVDLPDDWRVDLAGHTEVENGAGR